MVKGGKDNRSFRNIRRPKKKFAGNRHTVLDNGVKDVPAMEAEGTVNIFKRSMEKKGLRYVNFYGDGDSKSFSSVENIYSGIKVTKYECIGHVQKRMGNRLRKMRKTVKGLGGIGRLNDKMRDKLQNFYGISWPTNRIRPYMSHCEIAEYYVTPFFVSK